MNGSEADLDTLTAMLSAVQRHVAAGNMRQGLITKLEREFHLAVAEAQLELTLPPAHPAFPHLRQRRRDIWLTEAESAALLLAVRQWQENGAG